MSTHTPPFGAFAFNAGSTQLTWSTTVHDIFGLPVGSIVPTLELMSSHQHPQDRSAWDAAVRRILADGETFSLWHRVVDTRSKVHTVQTSVTASIADDGSPQALDGVITDLTVRLREDRVQEVAAGVAKAAETRAAIDQAKGIFMATLNIDEQQAFDLLRWHSSRSNVKLRDIAAAVVQTLAQPERAGSTPRQDLDAMLQSLSSVTLASTPIRRPAETGADPTERDYVGASTSRIPAHLLPATLLRAVNASTQSITVTDYQSADQPLVYLNAAFQALTGYGAEDILGRNCRFLQGADTDPGQIETIRNAILKGQEARVTLRNYRKDGTPFWNELHLSAVRDHLGTVTHYIGYQSDVSERVEREQQLERLAFFDGATGLPNRVAAIRHLIDRIGRSEPFRLLHIAFRDPDTVSDAEHADELQRSEKALVERLTMIEPSALLAVLEPHVYLCVSAPTSDRSIDALVREIGLSSTRLGDELRTGRAGYPSDGTDPLSLMETARLN